MTSKTFYLQKITDIDKIVELLKDQILTNWATLKKENHQPLRQNNQTYAQKKTVDIIRITQLENELIVDFYESYTPNWLNEIQNANQGEFTKPETKAPLNPAINGIPTDTEQMGNEK